jgi:hypothetical protein
VNTPRHEATCQDMFIAAPEILIQSQNLFIRPHSVEFCFGVNNINVKKKLKMIRCLVTGFQTFTFPSWDSLLSVAFSTAL